MTTDQNNLVLEEDFKSLLKINSLKKFRNKSILILGANSFLMTYIHFVFFHLNFFKKYRTKIFSYSKNRPRVFLKNFLSKDKNHYFYKKDLTNVKVIKNIVKRRYDYIFFAATYGQPQKWMAQQESTVFLNIDLLKIVLEKYKNNNCNLLFFSSADVYGESLDNISEPVHENFNGALSLSSPRAIYGESKRMAEALCNFYKKKFKINTYIIRAAHTYGPGMDRNDTRVIIDFLRKAKKGKIRLLDKGQSIKTYGYIKDITEMILNIILRGKSTTYNVCGIDYVKISELAKKVKFCFEKIYKKKVEIIIPDKNKKAYYIASDAKKSILSSNKYCKEFKKKNFVKIEDGVDSLIKYLNF
jgi:nucleoside-diphosphate-sugar epimerase